MNRREINRLPPEPKLAEDIGVSRVTVRRVLVRMESERLIDRQKGRGTFIRPTRDRPKVVVLHGDHAGLFLPWTAGILRGAAEEINARGLDMELRPLPVWGGKGLAGQIIADVRSHRIDGVLVLLRLHLKDCLRMREANIPLVLVEQDYGRDDVPAVLAGHAEAARMAAELLSERGRKRITLVSGPRGTETTRKADVIAASLQVLLGRALVAGRTHIITDGSVEEGRDATRRLLRRKTRSDVVFTTEDDLAVGSLLALREHDPVTQPWPDMVSYVNPRANLSDLLPWDVIQTPSPELLGKEAVSMLWNLMAGKGVPPWVRRLSPRLVRSKAQM